MQTPAHANEEAINELTGRGTSSMRRQGAVLDQVLYRHGVPRERNHAAGSVTDLRTASGLQSKTTYLSSLKI